MADELKLQITLDDGSVKEGFLKLEKQADNTSKKIGKGFSGNLFGGLPSNLSNVAGAIDGLLTRTNLFVAGVAIAAKKFGEFVLEGEKAIAANIQFRAVAEGAGLAADNLSEALIRNTQGLIDDEEALQIATKAITALGSEAEKLPEVLDLSRNISRQLGSDFKTTFENLSQFLETGNARLLRQYGIVLDVNAAYEQAAKSLGIATSELTEQQKQIVRTNLALEELPKKFQAGAQSVTPLADAFTRLSVSVKNSIEEIQKSLAEGITKTFIDDADKSNVATGRLKNTFSELSAEISTLEKRLDVLNKERLGAKGASALAAYAVNVDETKKQLKEAREEFALLQVELSGRSDQELFNQLEASKRNEIKTTANQIKLTDDQLKKINADRKAREVELTKFLQDQNIQKLQANLVEVNSKDKANAQILDLELRLKQQLEILEIQKSQRLAEVEKQFSADKKFTTEQRSEALLAIEANFQAQKLKLETDAANKSIELQKSTQLSIEQSLQASVATNKAIIENGLSSAIESIGTNLQQGKGLFDDFGNSVIAIFGDLAISIGRTLLFTGPAIEAFISSINSLLPGSGLAAAAFGLGLIIFGSALKASVGKGGSSASAGGGIASSPSDTTNLTQPEQLTQAEPSTQVSVVIQGDVLDSDESGSRIVDLINNAFDKKGVVINQGVLA
ncbi:MAG TPA: hypothetical protein V6C58_24560 [Allocoleopsis sp.]